MEQVFPEVVHTDGEGHKSVEYSKLVAPLIEAVKALKAENDQIKVKMGVMQSENEQFFSENQTLKQTIHGFEDRLLKLEYLLTGK